MRISLLVGRLAVAAALVSAAPVSAQTAGPLALEPISSTTVFAPDIKFTAINGTTGVLTGAYAGKLIENRVFLGGAAYWLADPHDRARMLYGGLLVGGRLVGDDRLNVTVRALAGIGRGTAYDTLTPTGSPPPHSHIFGRPYRWDGDRVFTFGYRDDFAVLEPEVRVGFRLTEVLSVNLGGGYRVTSADGWLNDAFRGATGSVGVQVELGKR